VHFERVSTEPSLLLGEAILHRFMMRDQPSPSDEQLLEARIEVAQRVQLMQLLEFSDQAWRRPQKIRMIQTFGLQLVHELAAEVAEFVTKLDGSSPLGELVDTLAREAPVPREKVEAECLSMVRKWLDLGFVRQLP
jgi:hypothetical protein